jgi:hypothetical protein
MSLSRRLPLLAALTALAVPAVAVGHELFDHSFPAGGPVTPPSPVFQAGGENAKWEALGTIATGNPHTDLDFFTQGGETFAAVGTLAAGVNGGGVTFVKLTDKDGKVAPSFVKAHPSASCTSVGTTGLQHDIEVTPKPAGVPLNTANSLAKLGDAQLVLDATDADGRCHDQGFAGLQSAPNGGLEIIDVSDGVANAKEIGLTAHIGESHTVNVDPKRPHIAYSVTSDSVSVDADGKRANDESGSALDGFEVVDLSSCMNFPAGTTLEAKRAACRPQVFRYRYPSAAFAQGFAADDAEDPYRGIYACHELEVYPDDRLTCASGAASFVFSMKNAFDDNGTPNDYTDDKPKGAPLPCTVRETTTQIPTLQTAAMITDCTTDGTNPLTVAGWTALGAPSLQGVEHVGTVQHIGRAGTGQLAKLDSDEDIDFSHEAELTHSGRYLIASDERGGGILPPGAACDAGDANPQGNGGLHFYDMTRLRKDFTGDAEEAAKSYARTAKGDKAIYRAPIRTGAQVTICTAHVFQQIPGQNRIFMGWYSQGTQVVDYTERPDGTLELKEAGYFIPAAANQWVSAIYKVEKNADGTFTYYGATGDFRLTEGGRDAIDLFKVTLPAPPEPRIDAASVAPAAKGPAAVGGSGAAACQAATGLRDVAVRPRKGGRLRFGFDASRLVDVSVYRVAKGRRVHGLKRVARFRDRKGAFTWAARGAADGTYIARLRLRGSAKVAQRVAFVRAGGKFRRLAAMERRARCDEVERLALVKPVFGGRTGAPLRIVARVTESGAATVVLERKGKRVKTVRDRVFTPGKTRRIAIPAKGLARGLYSVTVELKFGDTLETVTLGALRL